MLKKILITTILISSFIFVNGCSATKDTGIKITVNSENINYGVVENLQQKQSSSRTYKDTFKFAFKNESKKNIKYVKIGDNVKIDFGNIQPDKVTVKDILLNSNGEQLYTDREITNISLKRKSDKYSFKVEKNLSSALSSIRNKKDFRGYFISEYKGSKHYQYAFVVKTDPY